jgi:hypothetical protein
MASKLNITQIATKVITAPAKVISKAYTKADVALGGILPGGVPISNKVVETYKTVDKSLGGALPSGIPKSKSTITKKNKDAFGIQTVSAAATFTPETTTITKPSQSSTIPLTEILEPPASSFKPTVAIKPTVTKPTVTTTAITTDTLKGWTPVYQEGNVVGFSKGDKFLPGEAAYDPVTGLYKPEDVKKGEYYSGKEGGVV